MNLQKYITLMKDFTTQNISAHGFQNAYLDAFMNEIGHFSDDIHTILHHLYEDVKAYCPHTDHNGIAAKELTDCVNIALDFLGEYAQTAPRKSNSSGM